MRTSHRTKKAPERCAAACSRCTRVDTVRASGREAAASKIIGRGWRVADDRLVCPDCAQK